MSQLIRVTKTMWKEPPWRGALYKCLRCQHGWGGEAGPTECPKCGHIYVRWLNFDEMREAHR